MKNKLPEGWKEVELGEVLDYEQPTDYIVNSDEYSDDNKTPVLTAGKSFILGYTNEREGVYDKLPVIIFDDFTTASKFVTFPFKVKSSAMKLLTPKTKDIDLKFIFWLMQTIKVDSTSHKRYYLSKYQYTKIPIPPLKTQQKIVSILEKAEKAKEWRKEADELTKEFLKSVFMEMFGDPILNSKKYETKKGDELFKFSSGKFNPTSNLKDSFEFQTFGGNGITGYSKNYLIDYSTIVIGRVGAYCGCIHKTPTKSWITDNAIYIKDFKHKLDLDFLFYLFEFLKINRFALTVGQPKITQKPLEELDYIYPPLPLQQKFASIVREVEQMKEQQKHSKEQLDNLFNALMQKAFKGELA